MGDLAIGISKTAVEALVNKVKTAVKEEAELWQTMQGDTVFIKDEFEMMQSFLKTADWERIKNNVVRTWVRQVRDLSYDAEDFIESVLVMDTKRSFWTFCLRLLASCSCNPRGEPSPLDQAVAEVKLLKARVEDVSNRNMRYSLINDSGSNSDLTPQKLFISAMGKTAAVDILSEAWCTAKKQGGLVDLIMLMTENSDSLRVISLWQTGGDHGMTSIIKEAYENPEICQKFRTRAWLKVAHPFNPHEFIRSLAHQFYRNSWKEHGGQIDCVDVLTGMEVAQGTDLVREFVQKLNKHRYLVILEDLSNMSEWHAVRTYLPDSNNGSRIVVSTQQLEIARLCTGQSYQVLELRKLPDNHSICVFFHEGFKHVEEGIVDGGSSLETRSTINLVGRSSDENKLSHLISSGHNDRAHVISVWGFPGLGKSSLVKAIWQHHASNQSSQLFQWYGWVDLAYPFDLRNFCRRILSYTLYQSVGDFAGMVPQSEPDEKIIRECMDYLRDHRFLIVIDGLRSKEDWNTIKPLVLDESSKSCIIVITAEECVARYCAKQDDAVYGLKALGSMAALQLFRQEFRNTGTFRDAHVLKEAKYILEKCGGIPEVILAVARYLATQQEDMRKRKLSHLKTNFMQELETNPEFVSLRDLFAWMHFNFDALPQSLKQCILYQSVFSKTKSIRRSHFVRRWIAEGYSKCTDRKTMEEYAGELINRLAKHTTIMAEWRNNSFFHEYINSRLMEERVVFFPLTVSVLDDSHSLTTEGLGQHLTVRSSWKREDDFVLEDYDISHLQSLTVHGSWRSFFVPYKMRSLWVLDLEGTVHVDDDELKRILELLPRLRFLSLRGCKEITRLPDSLFGLRHLQTLDIRGTSVVYIELQKLQKLQYFRAGTTLPWTDDDGLPADEQSTPLIISSRTLVSCLPKFLRRGPVGPCNSVKVHGGIRHLRALHTLGAINVNTAGWDLLDEIYHLKQLKKLEVSGINRKNSKKLSRAIINQKSLESLSLQFVKENHVIHWDDISPPSGIRSLKLYGHVEKLSALRFRNLQNLRKLSLEMTKLFTPDDIMLLGTLSSLRTLRLRVNKDQDGGLQFLACHFSTLQDLEISCSSNLHISFVEGAMGKLEQLKFYCCSGSSLTTSGLKHLISLTQVWLEGSYNNTLKEALQQKLERHPKKPALKLRESAGLRLQSI